MTNDKGAIVFYVICFFLGFSGYFWHAAPDDTRTAYGFANALWWGVRYLALAAAIRGLALIAFGGAVF